MKLLFYIKLENDESLVITAKDTIYRGENLNQKIIYLIPRTVDDVDIMSSRIYLNYVREDGIADVVELEDVGVMYNERYYQYTLPINCKITNVAGNVSTWLHFIPNSSEHIVAKSGECILTVNETKDVGDTEPEDTTLPTLQDRVAFVEKDIEELNTNSHNHENIDELKKIAPGDVKKWNSIVVDMPEDGKSAYEIAKEIGFDGTIEDWLNSLKGENGVSGVTPIMSIDDMSNTWKVSYDNGKTWVSLGVKASGTDYILTETDKQEIAEQTSYLLDEKLLPSIGTGVLR